MKKGDFVVVRSSPAGVFAGEFLEMNGTSITLTKARKAWSWIGAFAVQGLAVYGPSGGKVTADGPGGKVSEEFRSEARITLNEADKTIVIERDNDSRFSRSYHGTARALIANLVRGAADGFSKSLEIIGVGYNAKLQGKKIVLAIGFPWPMRRLTMKGQLDEATTPSLVKSSIWMNGSCQ